MLNIRIIYILIFYLRLMGQPGLFLLFLFAFSYQFQNLCLTNRCKIQHIRSYHLQHSDLAFSQSMPNYCYAHDRKLRYCHENSPSTLKLGNETRHIVAYFL